MISAAYPLSDVRCPLAMGCAPAPMRSVERVVGEQIRSGHFSRDRSFLHEQITRRQGRDEFTFLLDDNHGQIFSAISSLMEGWMPSIGSSSERLIVTQSIAVR
jgi:hypothetical protein